MRSGPLRHIAHLSMVTAGVGLLGIGSYALLLSVNRGAPAADVAAFGSFWALTFGLVGGVLLPFEQLMVRATVGGGAKPLPAGTVLHLYAAVSVVLAAGLVAVSVPLADWLLGGDRRLVWVLAAYVLVAFAQSWQRGRAAGTRRLDRYGYQLMVDGGLRLIFGALLLATGQGDAYLAAVGLLVAGLLSLPFSRLPRRAGPDEGGHWRLVGHEALLMSASSTVSIWLLNAGPVVVVSLDEGHRAAAAFASLFVITRIPLLFQGSLQSVVIASVARHQERDGRAAVRRAVLTFLGLVGAAGVAIVVVLGVLADVWARLLYGPRFALGVLDGTGLALTTALFLLGAVCHATLVGLHATRQASVAWIASALVFGLVALWGPGEPVSRVVVAYLVSAVTLLAVQAAALVPALDVRATTDGRTG